MEEIHKERVARRNIVRNVLLVALVGCIFAAVCSAQRPSFDAASVKPVNLASHPVFGNRGGPGTPDPGRIHLCCVGMFSLLMRAYDVEIDRIIGPSWIMENMGPNLYQIDATMPPTTTKAEFQVMMQRLLEERFHLTVHREPRSFPGYELVIAKGGPKLKESASDPAAVAGGNSPQPPKRRADGWVTLPPGPQMLTSLGSGMIRVQAQEKPMDEVVKGMGRMIAQSLGENMNDFASRKPRVIDRTGLTGKYDFTLEFSCEGCIGFGTTMAMANGAVVQPQATGDNVGSGLPNIFVALEKQIGLKLIKAKDIPLDVIVVDHVEKFPTGN
jgi:uncharacterized protein (TIGR03435 family)